MSSIQQSFNQMLMSAQIGAGLYARSYTGQEQAKLREAKKTAQSAGERTTQAVIAAIPKHDEDKVLTKNDIYEGTFGQTLDESGAREVAAKKKLFEVNPSKETFTDYQKAKESLDKWTAEKTRYKEEKEMRRKLLEGTAEVPTNRTKIMEV